MKPREDYDFNGPLKLNLIEVATQLRKIKKEEIIQQKRCYTSTEYSKNVEDKIGSVLNLELRAKLDALKSIGDIVIFTEIMKLYLQYSDNDSKLHIVVNLKNLLSTNMNKCSDNFVLAVYKSGVVEMLVREIKSPNKNIAYFSMWSIIYITSAKSSEIENYLIIVDIYEKLKPHLYTSDSMIKEMPIWIIANLMGGHSMQFNEYIIGKRFIEYLADQMSCSVLKSSLAGTIAFAFMNIVQVKPRLDQKYIVMISPSILQLAFSSLLIASEHALWAISYLTDINDRCAYEFFLNDKNFMMKCFECLLSDSFDHIMPTIRVVGNMCSSKEDTKILINYGILDVIKKAITKHRESIKITKELYWVLSNLAAEPAEHLQYFIDCGLVEMMVYGANYTEFITSQECLIGVTNLLYYSSHSQLIYFIKCDCFNVVATFLSNYNSDEKIVVSIINSLGKLLDHCRLWNIEKFIYDVLERDGVINALETLKMDTTTEVYKELMKVYHQIMELPSFQPSA